MDNNTIEKIENFLKNFKNHETAKFYSKYLELKDHVISNLIFDKRKLKILEQLSFMIDDLFRANLLPLEVEDLFFDLIENKNIDTFVVDYDFNKNLYKISFNKVDVDKINSLFLISNHLKKIQSLLVSKNLIIDITSSKIDDKEIIMTYSLGKEIPVVKEESKLSDKKVIDYDDVLVYIDEIYKKKKFI